MTDAGGERVDKHGETAASPTQQPATVHTVDTVEALVRAQLSKALGGPRGVLEGAVPTAAFTITYVISDNLRLSLTVAIALAVAALGLRLLQRSTIQFVLNAAIGIGIAAVFAARSGRAEDAFLPGILYNAAYTAILLLSVVTRWPLIGFMVGAVTGDPSGWRDDPAMVKLCNRLTLLLALPCALRVLVQYPLYEAGEVGLLGTAKVVLGWPLQVAALLAMGALLARGRTPIAARPGPEPDPSRA